jgi:hypothetical protein
MVLLLAVSGLLGRAAGQAARDGRTVGIPPQAEQLFALANQARAAQGVGALSWDPALAAAALAHCQKMAQEGPIAHRYGDEADLTERAGGAGAHFSLIEENVALGAYPASIHEGWMHSPGHRANLLNADVNRVGIAVVAARGELYAVEDFTRAVPVLTQGQVEQAVQGLLRARGIVTFLDGSDARAYCSHGQGVRGAASSAQAGFQMLWQNADVTALPGPLEDRLAARRYREASVGSCAAQNVEGAFTVYRVAVLLY